MRYIVFILILPLAFFFFSCEKENEENEYFNKLIDKEWVLQNGIECSYNFSANGEYRYIMRVAAFNPETNEVTSFNDTTWAFWKLRSNIVMFSESNSFSENISPVDWNIIQLNDNLLEIKFVADMENPYIIPWNFFPQ